MPSVSIDEYLEVLWTLRVDRNQPGKIRDVAKLLKIAPPSVFQMFEKMRMQGLIKYDKRSGADFTRKGKRRARHIVRSHKLVEKLLVDIVGVKLGEVERPACGAEHYLPEEVADAICIYLKHPRECPHGDPIPKGKCCPQRKV
ncbi:MAG: metal-dependent transcriptional regulator [Candidatus Hodarchaeaceae archaeon]|nr:metal-dependent transcriptional regulator [Candidatus Hodarchaeaceae archaeon]